MFAQLEGLMNVAKVVSTKAPAAVRTAAAFVTNGNIIAVPTDTVYGLCCSANDTEAIHKLFDVKSRTFNKPISLCFSAVNEIEKWAEISHLPRSLIDKLLPGPVTLVLPSKTHLHPFISTRSEISNRLVVGVRIPLNHFINALCAALPDPIALTSANVSGKSDSISVGEFKELWPSLAGVFDDGTLSKRAASTVVDLSVPNRYRIIREGAGFDLVRKVLHSFDFEAFS